MKITREDTAKDLNRQANTIDIEVGEDKKRFRLTEYFGELKIHAIEGESVVVGGGHGVNEIVVGFKESSQ